MKLLLCISKFVLVISIMLIPPSCEDYGLNYGVKTCLDNSEPVFLSIDEDYFFNWGGYTGEVYEIGFELKNLCTDSPVIIEATYICSDLATFSITGDKDWQFNWYRKTEVAIKNKTYPVISFKLSVDPDPQTKAVTYLFKVHLYVGANDNALSVLKKSLLAYNLQIDYRQMK